MRSFTRIAAAAAAATLAVTLAACGGGGSNAGLPPVQGEAGSYNPQPRDNVKDGGTMKWAIEQFGPQWNYNEYDGAEASIYDVMVNALMPNLFISDESANVSPNPNYVTSST